MSKQIGNRSTSQKGLQPTNPFKSSQSLEPGKVLILKAKIENEIPSKQLNESRTSKDMKNITTKRPSTSKSPTPLKMPSRVSASPDTSMISQKSTSKGKFFGREETSVSKKVGKESRASSKEAPRLLSHKNGFDLKSHQDSKNSLSTRDESIERGTKKVRRDNNYNYQHRGKPSEVLFEISYEESSLKKNRSKSPANENIDPARRTMNFITPKPSVTPKESQDRERSSTKPATLNSRGSKFFETEGNDTSANTSAKKPTENIVSADDIQKKLQILRKTKGGLKKNDSKTELYIDHALRNKISDELILGSNAKTPKNFIKNALSPNQKLKKTSSQTEQSLKSLINTSVIKNDSKGKSHIRRESSPASRADLSFAVDKNKTVATKINLRSPSKIFKDDKPVLETQNSKLNISQTITKSSTSTKIISKRDIKEASPDTSLVSPRLTEKPKQKVQKPEEARLSMNKTNNLTHSQTSLKFNKNLAEKPTELIPTIKKDLDPSKRSCTSTAKKQKKSEEETCDKTTIQPSKNSDFFFQMNFFKPIEESKLDEFIQNINETKTKQTTETDTSMISPRMDHRASTQSRGTGSKINTGGLTPRDHGERLKEREKIVDRSEKSPDATRLNLRVSKDLNFAKMPKSKSPSHRIESMPVKTGLASRDNSSLKELTGKNEMVTTETYSRLDQLLQELKSNMDTGAKKGNDEEEAADKGLFGSENASESSSTTYSVNKSFAKNLMAFGNL